MRRIFIKALLEDRITIHGADAHHLAHVMRSKLGDKIVVADDEGKSGLYEIAGFTSDTVEMSLIEEINEQTESPIEIVLAQCLPKGDKLELIVQKATELGVNRIVPLTSNNCVVKYDAKKSKIRQEKWQKIANEAGKQCGRSLLPVVEEIQPLESWLTAAGQDEDMAVAMCYENEEQVGIKAFLQGTAAKRFAVVIGPEGGFSLNEAQKAKELGIASVSLGPRILRAETAAIGAVTVVQYEKGDLGGRR